MTTPNAGLRQVWTLPGLPQSARTARALARASSATPYQAEAAALCVSELVTNALVHSRSGCPGGKVTVMIEPGQQEPGAMRISVRDGGSRTGPGPCLRPPATDGPVTPAHGYGLCIVDAVAAVWGRTRHAGAWVTWCEIPETAS
jgi:anti-sigma regulatory factor (Ser/Thr protein kinase)